MIGDNDDDDLEELRNNADTVISNGVIIDQGLGGINYPSGKNSS